MISTLGGFRVSRNGVPVEVGDWGSRKARDLLKLLVARRGAPVVRDEAAALLWPDDHDRSARRLSVLLSTIRSVLDPDKADPPDHYVAADHDTAWLVREHVEVDVELFLREAAEGRRLLANGERAKAAASWPRRRRATSGTSSPTIPTPTGRPARESSPVTPSSRPPASSGGWPTSGPSTARPSATGCASSTSTRTTRPPTSS